MKYFLFLSRKGGFLEFCAQKQMDVRVGLRAIVRRGPHLGIDGFAEAEIECELRDDLPTETDISASAKTVHRRNGEGIKDVVFVGIDAVIPFASIEALESEPNA